MRILMVSMASLHFFRWTEQLKESGHEVYWFDVLDNGKPSERISWVHQIVGWKRRWDFPGRYYIKNKCPKSYKAIQKINERNTAKEFEKVINQIQPDVVHSFALYVSCTPILEVMKKHPSIKWIYSSWGSDLFYFKNIPTYLKEIKEVLPRVNYLFTDCKRDYIITKELGFKGQYLGVFPGGGGYDLQVYDKYMLPIENRNIILIKGFQGRSGRGLQVLKALNLLNPNLLQSYKCVVFGANQAIVENEVVHQLKSKVDIELYGMIPHQEVMQLMGKSFIYIGNSNSDGIPNTLLEAMIMGAFPIQSNPGGVTEELINDGLNGLLLEDCENIVDIKSKIEKGLTVKELILTAYKINREVRNQLEFEYIRKKVLGKYLSIETELKKS